MNGMGNQKIESVKHNFTHHVVVADHLLPFSPKHIPLFSHRNLLPPKEVVAN